MQKKYKLIAVSLLGLWHVTGLALQPMNDDDIVLYSLGYQLGEDIKDQQLEYNQQTIQQGIQDAMAGNEPMFSAEVQRQAMASVEALRAEKNLRKAELFLAQNGNRSEVKTLPSGLQYRVIKTGEGKTPSESDTVTVAYRGTLIDGTEFASSSARGKPATLKVNKIIKGLSEALQLMPTGSKWELYIHPKLGYGNRSPGDKVPANSALIYELELLSVK